MVVEIRLIQIFFKSLFGCKNTSLKGVYKQVSRSELIS